MTREEYHAKAMLLGMEYVSRTTGGIPIIGPGWFRHRVRGGRVAGTAVYNYFHADTLEPVDGMQERSEMDQTLQEFRERGLIHPYQHDDPL